MILIFRASCKNKSKHVQQYYSSWVQREPIVVKDSLYERDSKDEIKVLASSLLYLRF